MNTPINEGLLQSDLDCNGFNLLNVEVETANGIPVGGTTGQSLTKNSNTDYDVEWTTVTGDGGGGYTIVDTTVSGDTTRIIVPNVRVAGTTVVYCHGLGESDPTAYFDPVTSDKQLYMSDALTAGYLLAAGNFGGFNYSNSTAQTKIETLVAYLATNYGVSDLVLWSQSAGGPLGLLKATQGFSGVIVQGWFGIYPVVDLDVAHGNAALTASIDAAFPSYPVDAVGRDPIDFTGSVYTGLRLRCCGSSADTVVPKTSHGDALVTLAASYVVEATCIATSGDHGDPSNFTQARVDDFVAFLNRCFSSSGVGPYYIGTDARLVSITGGAKLEVRNPGTGLWASADQWTNP